MTNYAAVLLRRHQGREWSLDGNAYETLTITDGGDKPTQKELDDAWPDVKKEIAAEKSQKTNAIISGRAKLIALGLTDAEINALLGVINE